MSKKKKSLKFKLVFLVVVLLLAVVGLEIFIRLLGWAPELKKQTMFAAAPHGLPYLLKKNYHFSGLNRTKEFDLDEKTNSLGFFGPEWPKTKNKKIYRIVALGDSFTAGIARKDAVKYIDETRRLLNVQNRKSKFQIINLGVPGYFAEAEHLLFDTYALGLEPDMLLLNFCPNDLIDGDRGMGSVHLSQNNKMMLAEEEKLGGLTSLYLKSHLCRWLLKKTVLNIKTTRAEDDFVEVYKKEGRYDAQWQRILSHYRAINKMCQQKNITFVLTYIPLPQAWEETVLEEKLKLFCFKENISFVSARKALLELSLKEEEIYYPLDGHYKNTANQAIAAVVSQYLQKIVTHPK